MQQGGEDRNRRRAQSSWADSAIPEAPKGGLLGRNYSFRGVKISEQDVLRQLELEALKYKEREKEKENENEKDKENNNGANEDGKDVTSLLGPGGKVEDWTDLPATQTFEKEKIHIYFLQALLDDCFFLPPTLIELFNRYDNATSSSLTAAENLSSSQSTVIVPATEALECFLKIFYLRWQNSASDPSDRKDIFPFSLLNRLLVYLIERETEKVEDPALLFRENTNTSKLVQSFFRLRGSDYLRDTLSPMVKEIVDKDLKVDFGSSGQDKNEADKNIRLLKNIAQRFIDDIIASLKNVPPELKIFSEEVYEMVSLRYGGSRLDNKAGKNGVSAFFFLRFIVPAIITPHKMGIISTPQGAAFSRTFVHIAKIVQTLWNGTLFPASSAMTAVNSFVLENRDKAHAFVLSLALPASNPSLEFLPSIPETLLTTDSTGFNKLNTTPAPTTTPTTSATTTREKETLSPRSSLSLTKSIDKSAGLSVIGAFRAYSTLTPATLRRIERSGTPESEWMKQMQPTCTTLLKFILNHSSGYGICVGEMVHYNIRKGYPPTEATTFLRIKNTMEFIFEEADYIYALGVPPPDPLPAQSSTSSLTRTTPVTPSKNSSSTSSPSSPRTIEKSTSRKLETKLAASSDAIAKRKPPVKGRGQYYQQAVHFPYNSTTLLEWLGTEVAEHQYTILVFYRGQWCPFCRDYITTWDSLSVAREICSNNAIVFGVCSQTPAQTKKTQDKWKIKNFDLLGDPNNTLARYYALEITVGYETEGGYHDGMGQPGIIAFNQRGETIYYWSSVPSFKNLFGARDRPDPFDVLRDLSFGRTFGTGKNFTREKEYYVSMNSGGSALLSSAEIAAFASGLTSSEENCDVCIDGSTSSSSEISWRPSSQRNEKDGKNEKERDREKDQEKEEERNSSQLSKSSTDSNLVKDLLTRKRTRAVLPVSISDVADKRGGGSHVSNNTNAEPADIFLRVWKQQENSEAKKGLLSTLLETYPSSLSLIKEVIEEVDAAHKEASERQQENAQLVNMLLKNQQEMENRIRALEQAQKAQQQPQHSQPLQSQQQQSQQPQPESQQAQPEQPQQQQQQEQQGGEGQDKCEQDAAGACSTANKDDNEAAERRKKMYYMN